MVWVRHLAGVRERSSLSERIFSGDVSPEEYVVVVVFLVFSVLYMLLAGMVLIVSSRSAPNCYVCVARPSAYEMYSVAVIVSYTITISMFLIYMLWPRRVDPWWWLWLYLLLGIALSVLLLVLFDIRYVSLAEHWRDGELINGTAVYTTSYNSVHNGYYLIYRPSNTRVAEIQLPLDPWKHVLVGSVYPYTFLYTLYHILLFTSLSIIDTGIIMGVLFIGIKHIAALIEILKHKTKTRHNNGGQK